MPEIIVGSVAVTVVPDVQRFAKELAAKILPAADSVGKEAGNRIGKGIEDSVNDAVKRSAAKALATAGAQGKAIGTRLGENIKVAAEASRPEIKADVKLNKSSFTQFLAEIKALKPEVKASITLNKAAFSAFMVEIRALKPEIKASISLDKSSLSRFLTEVNGASRGIFATIGLKFTLASVAKFRSDVNAMLKGMEVYIEPKFTQAAAAKFRADVKLALLGMVVTVDVRVNKSSVIAARAAAATLMGSGGNFAAAGARAGNAWGGGFFRLLTKKIPLFGGLFGNAPVIGHISVWSLALHILTDALIVLIPALVTAAAGLLAFGVAGAEAGKQIFTQFMNIHTVGTALNKTIPPLTGNLKRMSDVVRPMVFQLLGAALNAAGTHAGIFNRLAVETGRILNDMAAKLDVIIKHGGPGLLNFLRAGSFDLKQFSSVLHSLGSIFMDIVRAGAMTQISEHLLQGLAVVLAIVARLLNMIPAPVLAAAISFMDIVHYGGLAITILKFLVKLIGLDMILAMKNAIPQIMLFGRMLVLLVEMNPWIAAIAALIAVATYIGIITFKAHQADAATKTWIDNMNKGLSSVGGGTAFGSMIPDIVKVEDRLKGLRAAIAPSYFQQSAKGMNLIPQILAGPGGWVAAIAASGGSWNRLKSTGVAALHAIGIGLDTTANDIKALTAEQTRLIREFTNLAGAAGYAMTKGFSFSQSLGLMNTAGVKVGDSLALMKQKIDNLIVGYEAMGQKGGTIGADMNALTVTATDQVTAMGKLNDAWDKFIGFLTAPPTTFLAWNSALTTFATNASTAGASMTSLTGGKGGTVKFNMPKVSSASVALQNQFESVIGASQSSLDALRNSNALGGTNNFTKSVKDMVSVLLPLTGGSKAALAQVSALGQEAGGPATLSMKDLATWSGNQHAAGAMADYYKQSNLAVTSTYNLNQDAQNLTKTLQADLTPAMANAILKASGAQREIANFAKAAMGAHGDIKKLYGTGKGLFDDLVKAGISPTSAKSMITGMLQEMHFTPAQIKQFWGGISKPPKIPAPKVGTPKAVDIPVTANQKPVTPDKPYKFSIKSTVDGSAVTHFTAQVPGWGKKIQSGFAGIWHGVSKNITSVWGDIWKPISKPVDKAFASVKQAIVKGFDGWWKTHGDEVKHIWNNIWGQIVKGVIPIWHTIASLTSSGIGQVKINFKQIDSVAKSTWKMASKVAGDAWKDTVKSAKAAWGEIKKDAKLGWDFLKFGWNIVYGIGKVVWKIFASAAKIAWAMIKADMKIAWDIFVGIINVALDLITRHWGRAWHDILVTGKQIWNAIKDALKTTWDTIWNLIGGVVKKIRDSWNTLYASVVHTLDRIRSSITGFFVKAATAVKNGAVGLWDQFYKGFIKPIEDYFTGLPAKITGAFSHLNIKSMIPGPVQGVLHTLHIPGFQSGTAPGGAAPGWSWVGERGRELVYFKGGETVLSNPQSERIAQGKGYASGVPSYNQAVNEDTLHPRGWQAEVANLNAALALDRVSAAAAQRQVVAIKASGVRTAATSTAASSSASGGSGTGGGMSSADVSQELAYLSRIAAASESAPSKTGASVAKALQNVSGPAAARRIYGTGSGY